MSSRGCKLCCCFIVLARLEVLIVDATWQLWCWMICNADPVSLFSSHTHTQTQIHTHARTHTSARAHTHTNKSRVCCWVTWQSPPCTLFPWSFLPFTEDFLWFMSQWWSVTASDDKERKKRRTEEVWERRGQCQRWIEAMLTGVFFCSLTISSAWIHFCGTSCMLFLVILMAPAGLAWQNRDHSPAMLWLWMQPMLFLSQQSSSDIFCFQTNAETFKSWYILVRRVLTQTPF